MLTVVSFCEVYLHVDGFTSANQLSSQLLNLEFSFFSNAININAIVITEIIMITMLLTILIAIQIEKKYKMGKLVR